MLKLCLIKIRSGLRGPFTCRNVHVEKGMYCHAKDVGCSNPKGSSCSNMLTSKEFSHFNDCFDDIGLAGTRFSCEQKANLITSRVLKYVNNACIGKGLSLVDRKIPGCKKCMQSGSGTGNRRGCCCWRKGRGDSVWISHLQRIELL